MTEKTQLLILIVEDDINLLESGQLLLEQNGYCVVTASDAQEALDYLSDETNRLPDLIIADLMLPEMGGDELLKELHQRPRLAKLPFIMGSTMPLKKEFVKEMESIGMKELLTKGNSVQDLLAMVAKYTT